MKLFVIARFAAEIFFPQRVRLKLHQHGFSPVALDKMVSTNAEVKSGGVAVKVLNKLTSISVSQSQLMQLTETIGKELEEARNQQATEYLDETLEPDIAKPPLACAVATDGGRIFTRADNAGRGVHDAAWKETKIAVLTSLSSQPSEVDPHPELPGCFGDKTSVGKLVREIKSIRNEATDDTVIQGDESSAEEDEVSNPLGLPPQLAFDRQDVDPDKTTRRVKRKRKVKSKSLRPKRLVRTSVASMCRSDEFGPMVASEAKRRRFYESARRAFLGDGLAWNWTLQKRYFPDFEAIVDFIHPMTYVFEASRVVDSKGEGWSLCERWLQAIWQGNVALVLAELRHWQTLHPSPPDEKLAETDARSIVAKAITYLSNNQSRMNYPKYRKAGLPVTSSMVESLIKEFNYRVKGTEKSWTRLRGCEAILQVRNAVLCDDRDRLSEFILSRPGSAYYRPSTTKRASEERAVAA
jgi:hypothetical protein